MKQNVEAAHEKQKVDYMPVHLCMSLGLKSLPKVLAKNFTGKKANWISNGLGLITS